MDINELKEHLPDEMFARWASHFQGMGERIDSMQAAEVKHKAKFKEVADDRDRLRRDLETVRESFGIDADADLSSIKPNATPTAQADAKTKRMQRELEERDKRINELAQANQSLLIRQAAEKALSAYPWIAPDLVEIDLMQRMTIEDGSALCKSADGRLIDPRDYLAGVAKTRPELLKAAGTGGAGVRQANAGSGGGHKTKTRAEWDAMPHAERASFAKEGGKVIEA